MRTTVDMPTIRIIDDLLPADAFASVAEAVEGLSYRSTVKNTEIWRALQDENPLESSTQVLAPSAAIDLQPYLPAMAASGRDVTIYPTGTVLDVAFAEIKRQAASAGDVIGTENRDWIGLTSRVYAYGKGTRADWHADGGTYTGAFIYYVHKIWDTSWGGDLLVQSPPDARRIDRGLFACPISNRLILLKGGTPHSVARISAEAENNCRRSIAGFFVTPSFAKELIGSLSGDALSAR